MTTFANATETIAHMNELQAKYGSSKLTVWLTADNKFIDVLVLAQLVKQGKITRTGGKARSAYATASYSLA